MRLPPELPCLRALPVAVRAIGQSAASAGVRLAVGFLLLMGAPWARSGAGAEGQDSRDSKPVPAIQQLVADDYWLLTTPRGERFDASGLAFLQDGTLLTVNDRSPAVYRVRLGAPGTHEARLEPLGVAFNYSQLAPFPTSNPGRYDCEGLAVDARGNLYMCEEGNRWVVRWDPARRQVDRLDIDWAPVRKFFSILDSNASFEGIALSADHLYLANERQRGRIIVVDAATLKVVDHFSASSLSSPASETHYSDLSWHGGRLYALLRESYCVVAIDTLTRRSVAEYGYAGIEGRPNLKFRYRYPGGIMEGLAVRKGEIWLATDNNGEPRLSAPTDIRPWIVRCRVPEIP